MITRMHLSSLGESTRVLQGFEQSFNRSSRRLSRAIRVLLPGWDSVFRQDVQLLQVIQAIAQLRLAKA
jgi:hypothetical protein